MESYTIEQQGMLKILEHIFEMLKNPKQITFKEINLKTGIDNKCWRKLIDAGIIQRSNGRNNPFYQWASVNQKRELIKPNIHMAKEVLKESLYFNRSIIENEKNNINNQDKVDELDIRDMLLSYKQFSGFFIFFSDEINRHMAQNEYLIADGYSVNVLNDFTKKMCDVYNCWGKEGNDQFPWAPFLVRNKFKEYIKTGDIVPEKEIFSEKEIIPQSDISFDKFWDLYDKKIDKKKSENLWNKISKKDKERIFDHIVKYKESSPDRVYRKNPDNYLRNECWNNEIINTTYLKSSTPVNNCKNCTLLKSVKELRITEFTWEELIKEVKNRGGSGEIIMTCKI